MLIMKVCFSSLSEKFDKFESGELSFKEKVYDFSVVYRVIDWLDILNIYKYLMVKKNIKKIFRFFKKCLLCHWVLADH